MQLTTSLLSLILITQATATIILGETAASGGPKDRNGSSPLPNSSLYSPLLSN